jgi:tripartite ATP-independent transporter DctM subunit
MVILLGFIVLLVLLIIGLPILYTFAASVILMVTGLGMQDTFIITTAYNRISSFTLICAPLFIIAGGIIEKGKMGEHLINFIELFLYKFKGSLAYVSTISCGVFGALTGSAAATLACIGSILSPKMKEAGYEPGFIGALFASASILGLLIPPSSLMIIAAWAMGLSVLTCFMSTMLPGIVLILFLCLVSKFMIKNQHIIKKVNEFKNVKEWGRHTEKTTFKAIPILVLPVIILGGIYGGFMTPTESSAVGALYAVIAAMLIYRTLSVKELGKSLVKSATTSGVVLMSIFSVGVVGKVLIYAGVHDVIAYTIGSFTMNKYIILLIINLILIIVGMLMDDTSGVLICAPLFLPIANIVGVDTYHFISILVVNLCMGAITPPTAPSLYMACRVCDCELKDMLIPDLILILFAWIPTLILTTIFPELSLFLPRLMGLL